MNRCFQAESTLVGWLLVLGAAAGVQAQSTQERGLEIATQVRETRRGFVGEAAEMELVLINASGDQVVRRMTSRSTEVEDDGDRSRITFQWPTDIKDTELLTWTHATGSDDQWLYLPSIQRVKRISSRNKSGSFMGSEFSYEDLGSQEVEQYTYNFLREESLEGRDAWVVERYAVDKLSGYSRQVVWYDKEYQRPLLIEYYDRKAEKLKTSVFSAFKELGGWWREHQIEVLNVQTGKSSIIKWTRRELGQSSESHEFERAALGE